MLRKLSTLILSSGLLVVAVSANAGTAGGVAFTSDYLFRGISQTSNNSAVQGTLTYNFNSGVYLTAWGSSIASPAGQELDLLAGYTGKVQEVSYDVGVMRYAYPGWSKENLGVADADGNPVAPDYNEVYGSVSYKGAKFGLNYSPDYFAESGKFLYTYVSYGAEVGKGVSVFASVANNAFKDNAMMKQALGYSGTKDSYIDYKVAASKTFDGVGVELAYVGSSIKEEELAGNISTGRVVFTASKSF